MAANFSSTVGHFPKQPPLLMRQTHSPTHGKISSVKLCSQTQNAYSALHTACVVKDGLTELTAPGKSLVQSSEHFYPAVVTPASESAALSHENTKRSQKSPGPCHLPSWALSCDTHTWMSVPFLLADWVLTIQQDQELVLSYGVDLIASSRGHILCQDPMVRGSLSWEPLLSVLPKAWRTLSHSSSEAH